MIILLDIFVVFVRLNQFLFFMSYFMTNSQNLIKDSIKSIPNYPHEGIIFRDITTLLENPKAFQATIEELVILYKDKGITKIVGTESRGFIFGAPLSIALGVPFVLVRKPGKLPREVLSQSYTLEYGQDTLEIHTDSVNKDDNVLIVDDLLATGGTAVATVELIRKLQGNVTHAAFVIGLPELGGFKRLEEVGVKAVSLVDFEGH